MPGSAIIIKGFTEALTKRRSLAPTRGNSLFLESDEEFEFDCAWDHSGDEPVYRCRVLGSDPVSEIEVIKAKKKGSSGKKFEPENGEFVIEFERGIRKSRPPRHDSSTTEIVLAVAVISLAAWLLSRH